MLCRGRIRPGHQAAQRFLGAVKQAGTQEVLAQLIERVLALGIRKILAAGQVLVHADGALGFTAPAEQGAERKVQLGGLGVQAHHLDERIDGLVGLLVEQEIQPLEIGARQRALLAHQLARIEAGSHPAEAENERQRQQPPGFKNHGSDFRANYVVRNAGTCRGLWVARTFRRLAARLAQRTPQPARLHALAHQHRRESSECSEDAQPESGQQDQDQRRAPDCVEKELQRDVGGVAQRQHEQQREQDDADDPGDKFHAGFMRQMGWIGLR